MRIFAACFVHSHVKELSMSKPSRRPGREKIKDLRRKKNANKRRYANNSAVMG
jgi:hypothetical protein